MNCYRCGRVMFYEKFYGPHEHFLGWKCIFCGEIIDRVILENRQTIPGRQKWEGRKESDT